MWGAPLVAAYWRARVRSSSASATRARADPAKGVPGEHLHIEYFPDHFYLAGSRIALVVARVD